MRLVAEEVVADFINYQKKVWEISFVDMLKQVSTFCLNENEMLDRFFFFFNAALHLHTQLNCWVKNNSIWIVF